jgi:hypothetical protein
MTIRNVTFVIAVLAAGGALAQDAANLPPFDPDLYPPEVRFTTPMKNVRGKAAAR